MKECDVTEIFASYVFNDTVMRARLPKEVYKSLKKTMNEGTSIDKSVAQVVANAMKDWAIDKGATHYTHWFQPMTGITAEKHDAFISPSLEGKVFMEFSGKELAQGEPDASSFPSGGLRATFEARGYTTWDPTSYAFVKDNTLYIPTAFCSYSGHALDKKTPLLRSMEVLNKEATRLLNILGNKTKKVIPTVGVEQEYFLVDRKLFNKRKDIMHTGRTLFGAPPPKGQEMNDHYFGNIKHLVGKFMKELDVELWKLGVYAKTKHNESAPAQHELACIYTSCNLASDHNQLVMETMKKIAAKHGLVCLLHEKPFEGINGSGKHNNWSLQTDEGENLLEPGKNPAKNTQFLLFLTAVIEAVNKYADLLRIAISSAGNDHRLGGHEAPPAIVSVYLGDELDEILNCLENGTCLKSTKTAELDTGVTSLADVEADTTDRNRTSPFAFTGNKFEFRMVGSSQSVSGINMTLNTIVAQTIKEFADYLDTANNKTELKEKIDTLLKKTIKENKKVIFNGNNYSEEWVKEAEKRGLPNYPRSVDAIVHFDDEKNVKLFTDNKIFTKEEVTSREEIFLENYHKTINVEALTMSKLVRKDIIPAVLSYSKKLADIISSKKAISPDIVNDREYENLVKLSEMTDELMEQADMLDKTRAKIGTLANEEENAKYCQDIIVPEMVELRALVDSFEAIIERNFWPYPTYSELLFSII